MLTIASRPYTDAELDEYSGRMITGRAYSTTVIMILALAVGGLATLGSFAVYWIYAWLTSGTASWAYPLIIGGAVAAITFIGLWFTAGDDDWTEYPPELATDVTATAYAAWLTDNESLDTVLVLRVEPDRYLLITENALTPPLLEDKATSKPADTIPSSIRLVLMGEREFRIAMNVSFTGHAIPLTRATAMPADTDPDRFDETPIPDGLYMTDELPARIRRCIDVA